MDAQIGRSLRSLDADPRFSAASSFWLTFYLTGDPKALWLVADALAAAGWANTGGWDGGFLYPKVHATRSKASILGIAAEMLAFAEKHDVHIIGIDADTSPDVERSQFVPLYSG